MGMMGVVIIVVLVHFANTISQSPNFRSIALPGPIREQSRPCSSSPGRTEVVERSRRN